MYLAGYMVTGFLVAGAYAFGRLRGRWGRYERTALAIPLTIAALASPVQVLVGDWAGARGRRAASRPSSPRSRACAQTTRGAPVHLLGWYTDGQVKYGHRDPEAALAARLSTTRTRACRDSTPSRRPTGRRSTSSASRSRLMVGIGTLLALLGVVYLVVARAATTAARIALVLPRPDARRPARRWSR